MLPVFRISRLSRMVLTYWKARMSRLEESEIGRTLRGGKII